jgi:sterol desaturase/sphingolipid hydroxylase (fatty acid hydroxylase superfamily)
MDLSSSLRYMLPALIVIALAEALIRSRVFHHAVNWRENFASIGLAVGQKLSALLTIGVYASLFAAAWNARLVTVPLDTAWGIALLFFAVEFFYYWHHRLSHECRWFWATHAVHHSPEQLSLSTAYRLGWTGGISGSVLVFVPLAWLGFHPAAILTTLALNLLYQFWLHSDWIPKLGPIEWIFNTPSHHRVHHAVNQRYLDRNYGGVLIVFDRLFGTFSEERADDAPRYGLVKPIQSHNPFRIAFHEWARIVDDVRHAKRARDVLGYLFAAPGWQPDGKGVTSSDIRASVREDDTALSMRTAAVTKRPIAITTLLAATVCALGLTTASEAPRAEAQDDIPARYKDELHARFKRADTNKDGKLTKEEAKGVMPRVHDNFDRIDSQKRGYVTLAEIESFARAELAKQKR